MRTTNVTIAVVAVAVCFFLIIGSGLKKDPELDQVIEEAKAAMSRPPTERELAELERDASDDPPWDDVSSLKSEATASELQGIANDASMPRDKRAKAIFSLFANYVKLPQGAAAVGKVLKCEEWRSGCMISGITFHSGPSLPVKMGPRHSVFSLRLFPSGTDSKHWVIYLRLSGGPNRKDGEARAFLQGAENLKGDPQLVEFALCFPAAEQYRMGRIERFSEKGIAVYDPR